MAVYTHWAWLIADKFLVEGKEVTVTTDQWATLTVYRSSTELCIGTEEYGWISYNVVGYSDPMGESVTFNCVNAQKDYPVTIEVIRLAPEVKAPW